MSRTQKRDPNLRRDATRIRNQRKKYKGIRESLYMWNINGLEKGTNLLTFQGYTPTTQCEYATALEGGFHEEMEE
uniref:Uncharacterized protein n=1 Tax=Oryza barthii TaxID=65489 RepID=A0A0D3FDP5_9ORYZ